MSRTRSTEEGEPRFLDLQTLFERISQHLLKQGKASKGPNLAGPEAGMGLYRSAEGLRCGVGAVIHDDAYCVEIEGASVEALSVPNKGSGRTRTSQRKVTALRKALKSSGVNVRDPATLSLLEDFQDLHDYVDPGGWALNFSIIAGKHGLKYPLTEG